MRQEKADEFKAEAKRKKDEEAARRLNEEESSRRKKESSDRREKETHDRIKDSERLQREKEAQKVSFLSALTQVTPSIYSLPDSVALLHNLEA